jgi:hypothetical protein
VAVCTKVGDFRVAKNADLRVDFNTSRAMGGQDVSIACRVAPFEVYYSRRLVAAIARLSGRQKAEEVGAAALRGLGEWQVRANVCVRWCMCMHRVGAL